MSAVSTACTFFLPVRELCKKKRYCSYSLNTGSYGIYTTKNRPVTKKQILLKALSVKSFEIK